MSKKTTLGLVAIVVLAVAIGLYSHKKGKLGVSSNIDVGGNPTGISELRFANEVDFGIRDIPIPLATTTANFSNLGKARVIDSLDFKFTPNSTTSLSAFWIVAATSTATTSAQVGSIDPFPEPTGPTAPTFPARPIYAVFIATSTYATSTPFSLYQYDAGGARVRTGRGIKEEPLVLQNGEALWFHIYHDSIMPAWSGKGAGTGYSCNDLGNLSVNCIRNATITQTGFTRDIILKYHD